MVFQCLGLPREKLILGMHDYKNHEGLRNRNRPGKSGMGVGGSALIVGKVQLIRDEFLSF